MDHAFLVDPVRGSLKLGSWAFGSKVSDLKPFLNRTLFPRLYCNETDIGIHFTCWWCQSCELAF